jgi:choline-sulfatase
MASKPNIVFILADQHRGDSLGCAGHPAVLTPHLDRLASEGVVFDTCFTNAPLCMPARASLMTGQYVREHGVWNNALEADPSGPSHVRAIRDSGYRTALVGKTHLYMNRPGRPHTRDYVPVLREWGFEDVHETHGLIQSIFNDSPYTEHLAAKGLLDVHRRHMLEYTIPWLKGEARPWEDKPSPLPEEDLLDSYIGRKAAEWIRDYDDPQRPFYLQALFLGPHDPYDSPDAWRKLYRSADVPLGILDKPAAPVPPYVQWVLDFSHGIQDMTADQMRRMRALYYAKASFIDAQVGAIIGALEGRGMLENTWVVYSSDHGDMLGDHGLTQKVVFYESALRIPLIVRPPGGMPARRAGGLCDLLDLCATLIEMAGAAPLPQSDGRSLLSQILKPGSAAHGPEGKGLIVSEVVGYSQARDKRFKLAVEADTLEPVEMFDLEEDPHERRNVVSEPAYEGIRSLIVDRLRPLARRLNQERFGSRERVAEVMPTERLLKRLETLYRDKYAGAR